MERIKGTALSAVCALIGLGLLSTGISQYEPGGLGALIAMLLLGALMLAGAVIVFVMLALPAWRDREHTLRDELGEMVHADQSGAEDADEADALISAFRKSLRAFFAAPGTPENSPLQHTATQLFWHILYLQKRRMERLGVCMDFTAERKSYGGVSVAKRSYFDGKYIVTDASERIAATRVYRASGRAHTVKDTESAHYGILNAKRVSGEEIICPSCGSPTTRENLLDGCDWCGTKFTVEDLGARVSSFALREDYQIAYDKYRDSRRYYGVRAFLAGAVPVFLIAAVGMFSVHGELDAGPVMQLVAIVFGAAFCAGAAGLFSMYGFFTMIFPLIQAKQSLTYRSKKKLAERRLRESWNAELEQEIRRFDPLFSLEGFFSNIQNKLAAIHYAERAEEVEAFADLPLADRLGAYADVVDMDVTELSLLSFRTDEALQHIELRAAVRLTHARGARFSHSAETLRLSLEKSAACKTEAVCGPSILRCKSCGASLSLLDGGRCAWCGSTLELRRYDWVITGYRTE